MHLTAHIKLRDRTVPYQYRNGGPPGDTAAIICRLSLASLNLPNRRGFIKSLGTLNKAMTNQKPEQMHALVERAFAKAERSQGTGTGKDRCTGPAAYVRVVKSDP